MYDPKDALAEMEKDGDRCKSLDVLRSRLEVFKHNPTPDNRQNVVRAARAVDEIVGGYQRDPDYHTDYSSGIEAELDSIVQGP